MKNKFCINQDYVSRETYTHHDDTSYKDQWQLEVYLKAKDIMEKNNYNDVLDIGCGSGYKLINYLGRFNTVGTELEVNLNFLDNKYPNNKWIVSDFSCTPKINCDVLICSDVIEHLVNPDELMDYLSAIDFKILLLSTPERELVHPSGSKHLFGPPANPSHIREWNYNEFGNYVKRYFNIIDHYISNHEQYTQLIICKKPK